MKAIVHWYLKRNPEKRGRGSEISLSSAKAAVTYGNTEHPELHHYLVKVRS